MSDILKQLRDEIEADLKALHRVWNGPESEKLYEYGDGSGARAIVTGKRYDTPELVRMGLLPPEMAQTRGISVTYSTVTEVDQRNRVITFDAAPISRKKRR